jgi:hypothetical protein
MRVRFFIDNMLQPMYDNRQVQFNATADLPAPAIQFFVDHFRQAVFANMKGAGKVTVYDHDPTDDAQNMSVFEGGEGKEYLEGFLMKKLVSHETSNHNQEGVST